VRAFIIRLSIQQPRPSLEIFTLASSSTWVNKVLVHGEP
jgi:hypothetical protein